MKKLRLSALVLAGALSLSLLTACGGGEEAPEASESPVVTESEAPAESAAPVESETPAESEAPAQSAAPAESGAPAQTAAPVESKAPAATPAPVKPTPAPEAPADAASVIAAFWSGISTGDLPALMDMDADMVSAFYGIDAADLESFLYKIPSGSQIPVEFFMAKVAPGRMDAVKAGAAARQNTKLAEADQYPDYLDMVQDYKLVVNGDYILYVVAPNADQAVVSFNSCTK